MRYNTFILLIEMRNFIVEKADIVQKAFVQRRLKTYSKNNKRVSHTFDSLCKLLLPINCLFWNGERNFRFDKNIAECERGDFSFAEHGTCACSQYSATTNIDVTPIHGFFLSF